MVSTAVRPPKKLNLSMSEVIPFALCHVIVLGAFFTGVTWQAWALCFGLLFIRMWGVTAGNMDSMINHYTANKKVRNDDAYSPGGQIGLRPDRATLEGLLGRDEDLAVLRAREDTLRKLIDQVKPR